MTILYVLTLLTLIKVSLFDVYFLTLVQFLVQSSNVDRYTNA